MDETFLRMAKSFLSGYSMFAMQQQVNVRCRYSVNGMSVHVIPFISSE